MLLFINACVRENSRTERLAKCLLEKLDQRFTEVRLEAVSFPVTNEAYLTRRDQLIEAGDFSDPSFSLAHQFASADRIVPIPETLYEKIKDTPKSSYIASYNGGGKITDDNRKRMWKAFKRDMNIEMGAEMYRNELQEDLVSPDLVPYCFRHDYCTRLAKAGVDIRTAQYLMGHKSIDMTANIYTHIDDSSLLDAAKKMF